MPCQIPADCLNEIFEYLEEDKITLRSCLLVNHLWCQVVVRILWMNVWSFKYRLNNYPHRTHVPLAILSTLIACLPSESKEVLYVNGIIIPTPTSNPPSFNYASFCKVLPISKIDLIIQHVLENQQSNTSQSIYLYYNKYLISRELLKMFMQQISSLKSLDYNLRLLPVPIPKFTYFPGAKDCLTNLSVFSCNSDICSEIFIQLSQICHNIQSLTIALDNNVSNGLKDLISSQNNLKDLNLFAYEGDWSNIMPALTTHYDTLTRLHIYSDRDNLPLSFVPLFSNLQEIKFSFDRRVEDFKEIQNITIPKLEILKIPYGSIKPEYVIKFLETNGKNLKELDIDGILNDSLKSSIAKFCSNLTKLFIILENDELNILKTIFNSCQRLESIQIWYSNDVLNEKEMLKVVAKYSPKDFYELKMYNEIQSELLPEDFESFFISWKSRTPKKSLVLIINYDLDINEENMKVIEKYKSLGVIKRFETKLLKEEENDAY